MSAPRKNDDGTVLLTTLLVMTVMAALTMAVLEDVRLAVKRTINVDAYAQLDWTARGAEDFTRNFLATEFSALPDAAKTAALQSSDPIILPTPTGTITLQLHDASQCFNLNALVSSVGLAHDAAVLEFSNLLSVLGVADNQGLALANALTDWMDADMQPRQNGAEDGTYLRRTPPYRTANTALSGPEELRAIDGMDDALFELLRPFICTGEVGVLPPVNVNALGAEHIAVLAAAMGGRDAVPLAQTILRERPMTGYADLSAVQSLVETANQDGISTARLGLSPTAVQVDLVIAQGTASRARTLRYDGLDNAGPMLTYRGWGRAAFWPEILTPDAGASER